MDHYYKGKELYGEYERGGNLTLLSEAIVNFREAFALSRGDFYSPIYRSSILNELALALVARYEGEGNADDLALAITYHEEVLTPLPTGHSNRSGSLNNLGNALRDRYEREGNMDDLSRSITYYQESLSLRPVGDPDRPIPLNNLGTSLRVRYEQEGNVDDLSLSIAYLQEALTLLPVGTPGRSATLNNLGISLRARYNREGNMDDLSLSIKYLQEDLSYCPVGAPGRSATLNNLGLALRDRYKRERNVADLLLAIQYHQEDLTLCPVGHPRRSATLNNLASALETRYEHEGSAEDYALAITYRHEVLDLRPPGHPSRSQALYDLAYSYWNSRNKQELLGAINQSHGAATRLLGANSFHPQIEDAERSSTDHYLQDSLTAMIISLLREASRSENCSARDWLEASLRWIKYSKVIDPKSTTEAYTAALHQLDTVLALGQSLEQRQDCLLSDDLMVKTRDLGDEAATWAIHQGELERAVEFLEQGRSLLLAQLGRYRAELDDLRQLDSELAARFEDLSRHLESSISSNTQIEEASLAGIDSYERYRRLSKEWNATVETIRTKSNLETFLKPLPYEQLRKAAAEGPVVVIIPDKECSNALIVREHEPIHRVCLPLADSSRLSKLSNDILHSLKGDDDAGNRTEGLCLASMRSLWNEVVGPIARALQNDLSVPLHSRVWWCPTSMTSFLPLHAAGLYSPGKPGENFPNLYTSSYTPNLHALLRARRDTRPSEPKKLLVVAQPAVPSDPPLRYAVEEATIIQKIVSPTLGVEMLSGEAGTCKVVQCKIGSHPWVHFICHGIQAARQPLDSYLLLHDGPLTLRMIIQQKIPNADFAFLSACHSAAGDKVLANEALHLAAAMQFAGFRGVVGTLWEMADENGPPLAEAFYREMIKQGDSRGAAKALSEAVKQLRRNRVPLNLWMRFVHIGI